MYNYIKGDDVFLYIYYNGAFNAISCLIDNPLEESTEEIETTVRGSGAFRSYIPGMQDYRVSFTANMVVGDGFVSYDDIRQLKRERISFEWRLADSSGEIGDTGTAFISRLDIVASVNQMVTFSATLTPSIGGLGDILLWSQDGFNVVSQDGLNEVQVG